MKYLLIALALINIAAFGAFGLDKWYAGRGMRRISERRLLQFATYFGGLGAWIGSRTFRHKTKKRSFLWRMYLALALNLAVLATALYWFFT